MQIGNATSVHTFPSCVHTHTHTRRRSHVILIFMREIAVMMGWPFGGNDCSPRFLPSRKLAGAHGARWSGQCVQAKIDTNNKSTTAKKHPEQVPGCEKLTHMSWSRCRDEARRANANATGRGRLAGQSRPAGAFSAACPFPGRLAEIYLRVCECACVCVSGSICEREEERKSNIYMFGASGFV